MTDISKEPVQFGWDLKKLLKEWKLENILPHLIAQKVDVDILKMMKASHITLLLHSFPVGIQIRFECNLEEWRQNIGKPLQFQFNHDRNEIINNKSQEKDIGHLKDTNDVNKSKSFAVSERKNTDLEMSSDSSETYENYDDLYKEVKKIYNFKNSTTLENVKSLTTTEIFNHVLGQILRVEPELLMSYHKHKKFSSSKRNDLIRFLVFYYMNNNIKFDLQTSYDLENAIMERFPGEKLESYRNSHRGIIYLKYMSLKHKKINRKNNDTNDLSDKDSNSDSNTSSNKPLIHNVKSNNEHHQTIAEKKSSDTLDVTAIRDAQTIPEEVTEILLQTLYNGVKKFVKIFKPFSIHGFLSTACAIFNISNMRDLYVTVNDCEISDNDFENVILQYYKLTTFIVELKEKVSVGHMQEMQLTKVEHTENSCYQSDTYNHTQSDAFSHTNSFINTASENPSVQIIYNHLPDANDIRNIPSLMPIVKIADMGKPLENKHRTNLAKAIIDECLNFQPDRILKRQDFFTLTDNLIRAFPNEVASAYFIPSQPNHAARGKLWNAYNNKRSFLGSSGIVQRRQINNVKRKHSDKEDDTDKSSDKIFVTENLTESLEFSQNTTLDWNTLQQKWSSSHRQRRNELLKQKMSIQDYMHKYSILKCSRGIDLMEIDVNILHPTVANVNNWLSIYDKVVEKARKIRKFDIIPKTIEAIDNSNDEKYRASLALVLISYIFPYNARRNEFNGEKASKCEIQERFVKEYQNMDDLESDIACAELQIRFVHQSQQIVYAEFNVGGCIFKSVDLLEALSSIFHYIMAMNIEYPQMCLHIWQFVQLAIFQIEIQDYKLPNVDSTINDLYMN